MTDAPGGLWIGQQKVTPQNAQTYNLPLDPDRDEMAWLVDWNGKLLKTVKTHSRNTSGMAYGDGCVWMGANADPYGIFQVDMNAKQITHRQIPLSIDGRRWWLPWCEVAQRQALDCRPAPGRHPARRSDDVGSRSLDPRELGGEASPSRRGVRQRGQYLGRDRQQQHQLRRGESRPEQVRRQDRSAPDDGRVCSPDRATRTGWCGTTDASSAAMPASTRDGRAWRVRTPVTSSASRSSRSPQVAWRDWADGTLEFHGSLGSSWTITGYAAGCERNRRARSVR